MTSEDVAAAGVATAATSRPAVGPQSSPAPNMRFGGGDLGAGPRRKLSLSEVALLPWLCCMAPAIVLFSNYLLVLGSAIWSPCLFDWLCALLTCITWFWIANMCISSGLGAKKLRENTAVDWHARLADLPEEVQAEVKHIVLLPNYLENEQMLKETLDNLARSPLAQSCVHVVLAMEAREGQEGQEKAARIVEEKKHLFADIFATFHPKGLPGETAGKSSNTQFAFRQALRKYGAALCQTDLSKIFLTVADADTLLHPQYLSALTYQGLVMEKEERSWTMFQPPVLLSRNLFSVPSLTRSTSHATLVFELAGLSSQHVFPAFAFSTYSMTLALASHPEVDGWDVDVIAEDHHMFCKCYFAALWELLNAKKASSEVRITPRVKVQPIFLPAVSFLVEADGYIASLRARFQQARRHMQGIVELGYVLLQWIRLSTSIGVAQIPKRTHLSIALIAIKMYIMHIVSSCQCFALVLVAICRTGELLHALQLGSGSLLGEELRAQLFNLTGSWSSMSSAQQALAAAMSQVSGIMMLYTVTCAIVAIDLMEGTYHKDVESSLSLLSPKEAQKDSKARSLDLRRSADPQDGSSRLEMPGVPEGRRSWLARIALILYILVDNFLSGYPAWAIFAVIPVLLAGWSLLRRGTDFEYVVALKPK